MKEKVVTEPESFDYLSNTQNTAYKNNIILITMKSKHNR